VREFVEMCFKYIDIQIKWSGYGIDEKGIDSKTGEVLVEVDKKYLRPLETEYLQGDYTKIKNELGWNPKTNINQLVQIMMKYELSK
jgi:GDPmannose 4,6-dehydratase